MSGHARCRFCGSQRHRVKPLWHGQYWFVACERCRAAGPAGLTPDEAWRMWDGEWEWPPEGPVQATLWEGVGE